MHVHARMCTDICTYTHTLHGMQGEAVDAAALAEWRRPDVPDMDKLDAEFIEKIDDDDVDDALVLAKDEYHKLHALGNAEPLDAHATFAHTQATGAQVMRDGMRSNVYRWW